MRKHRFSLEQVRTFIAVAEAGHISEAASTIFLTQGAVTQQVRHFERALGVQLIERLGRGIRLTDAGRAVATACASSARSLDAIAETASLYSSISVGSLELGASPTAASNYLPALLSRFSHRFPEVEIRVSTANSHSIAGLVASGVLDFGLVELFASQENLVEWPVQEDELRAVVHRDHPLARLKIITAEELKRHRYIAREAGSVHEEIAREILGDLYPISHRLQVDHLDAVRANVIEGLGYAVLPTISVAKELESGILVGLPRPATSRWIYGIRRESLRSPALEEFWQTVTGGTLNSRSDLAVGQRAIRRPRRARSR